MPIFDPLQFANHRAHLAVILAVARRAADPGPCLAAHWPTVANRFESAHRLWGVGAGKAALAMALKLSELLGERIAGGALAVVPEHWQTVADRRLPFDLYPAAHPLPDERNVRAAQAIGEIAAQAAEGDWVIALISGGGSAHLTLPAPGLTLADLQEITAALLKSGAPITALNTVRKHCEQLKGGGLLRLAAPARVHAFILSDVIGDPIEVIASGLVAADPTTYADALNVLDQFQVAGCAAVRRHLIAGCNGQRPETLKPGDPILASANYTLIGNNAQAVQAAREAAESLGFEIGNVDLNAQGEARAVGAQAGWLARQLRARSSLKPVAVIWGGETTVAVRGDGLGGRNQELALAAALAIDGLPGVALATFSTDGVDGPTPAAGAYVTGETCRRARALGLSPESFLQRNDSYTFFERLGDLIATGPTGTNVNDVLVGLVYPQ
jgi:hydroxypyruvate reductase